jgi:trimeric autotransporter adhesin
MLRKLFAFFGFCVALGISIPVFASGSDQTRVASRVTAQVDDSVRTVLKGNVHPMAQARFDRGAVSESMPASRLILLLKHSPTQAAALREYIDSLQDKNSPNYHKWLTPEQFGANYGPSDHDLKAVTDWLQLHGFAVNRVAKARNMIEFSGTAGQVQEAFHTAIHNFVVNGERHFANVNDPEIPAALAPVVAGVTQLHNFQPRRNSVAGKPARWNADSKKVGSQITWIDPNGNTALYVVPADAATIYNTPNAQLNPAYTGTTYDGTGVTVGIAGDSNFTMQDVANYRAFFLNDTSTAHLPNVVIDGNDPGVNGDAGEALLDNEIVSGLAPGAKINFYTSQNTDMQSGLFLAIFRALDDNAVDILNVSFGGCEQSQSQVGNQQLYSMWEQAATQGISVTVSGGDSGSANCDDPNTEAGAGYGLAVSGIASTPYTVAVGGTDFGVLVSNYPTSFNQYMNASGGTAPYYGSVLGYIPETVWNESTQTNTTLDLNVAIGDIWSGGGGMSSCSFEDSNGQCLGGYPKPAYQTNLTPSDGVRDLPDVAFFAAAGFSQAAWAVCADNVALGYETPGTDCQLVSGKPSPATTISGFGGTSAASPAFAGMLALISQSTGGRLGNPDQALYELAATKPADFNDVTVGNNSVDCWAGSPNCNGNGFLTGYNSEAGYDLATGLGSVNAAGLLKDWPTVALASSSTTLELGLTSSSLSTSGITATHGAPINFDIAVAPGASVSGNVTFVTDSDVSVMPSSGAPTGLYPVNTGTSSGGVITGSVNTLPGGTYNVYAYYGGDTNYAASKSNPIPVNIGPEDSTTSLSVAFYDATSQQQLSGSSAPYGSYFFATAISQGKNGVDGTPTGKVSFQNGSTTVGSASLNSAGTASYNSLSQNPLPAGTYSMVANYAGDASYNPSASSSVPFVITKGQLSSSLSAASSGVNYAGSITFSVSIATDSVGAFPTGSVTFMSGPTMLGTAAIVGGYNQSYGTVAGTATATIAGTMFPKNGLNTITAVYAGDNNYSSSTSNGIGIQVTGVPNPAIGVSGPASVTLASPGASTNVAITVTPFGGFTGAVNIQCVVSGPASAVAMPTCSSTSATVSGTTATTATLNVASGTSTPAGSYWLNISGADAATGKITSSTAIPLTVNAAPIPTFALAATAAEISGPGASAVSTISVTPSGGFTGAVALTCSGSGLTCDPATATVGASGGTASLTIHAASATTPGTYSLAITGVDSTGKISASTTAQVTVDTPVTPTLTIAGTAVTITPPGASSASAITLTPGNGFTGTVTLTCAVAASPSGATSAPSCPSTTATISGTAAVTTTLNLQTTSTTTPGAYTVAVTATAGGSTVATANVAVTVNASVGFALSGTSVTIPSLGGSGNSTVTVTPSGGFTGQINLTCALASAPTGASNDAACTFGSGNYVVISGSTAMTATMTVTTTTTKAALQAPHRNGWLATASGTALAGLFLFCLPARRRYRLTMLALLLTLGGVVGIIGCGGGGGGGTSPVTGAGAYSFTVTGTDAASGSIVSKATITVTVQ